MPTTDTTETRPSHYGGDSNPHEPIKVIEHYDLDYHRGSAVAYILRAGLKHGEPEEKDLSKAIWFLQRRIDWIKKKKQEMVDASKRATAGLFNGTKVKFTDSFRVSDSVIVPAGTELEVMDVDHTPGKEGVKVNYEGGLLWAPLSAIWWPH